MHRSRVATLVLLASCAGAASTAAQVTLTRIVDETTPIGRFHGTATRTALHAGQVAFVGTDHATQRNGVYITPASGAGPVTVIADTATPIPGSTSGETFDRFYGADVLDGQVLFAGARFVSNFFEYRGTYLGSGGPLTTLLQAPGAPGDPPGAIIASLARAGIAYRGGSPYYEPWVLNTGGSPTRIWLTASPAPGGGTFFSGDIGDNPARVGDLVVFLARVNHAGGSDGGVYTYNAATGARTMVVNWTTQMPGRTESFDYFHACDTDGATIAFTGKTGVVGQGGHEGVYTVPVGGGPIQTIAQIGDPVPADGGVFSALGFVAVEGDLVVFEGFKGVAWSPSYHGLFARRLSGGAPFKLVGSDDTLAGAGIASLGFNFRGLSGNQAAFDVFFDAQAIGVYVATIAEACYPDCNADSTLTVADFGCFQTRFVAGDLYADCNADGGLTVADFGCFQTGFTVGCP